MRKADGGQGASGHGRDWTAGEITYLLDWYGLKPTAEIAAALDRTEQAVRLKLHRLRRNIAAARMQLPARRLQVTEKFEWHGQHYLLSVGFDGDGRAGEVFLAGTKAGTDINGLMLHACMLLSWLLQYGGRVAWIAEHLADPHDPPDKLTSLIAMVARRAAALEREFGADMQKASVAGDDEAPPALSGAA
jgi:hypothetical protein